MHTYRSILTVDPEEAKALGKPKMRRYIYNTSKCPRCGSSIKTWQINKRNSYACMQCQPLQPNSAIVTPLSDCIPFNSHCARETVNQRLRESGASRLTVKEIRTELSKIGKYIPTNAKKAHLVDLLNLYRRKKLNFIPSENTSSTTVKARIRVRVKVAGTFLDAKHIAEIAKGRKRILPYKMGKDHELKFTILKEEPSSVFDEFPSKLNNSVFDQPEDTEGKIIRKKHVFLSSEDAAAEKAAAGESLSIEHIAELAPAQVRKVRSNVV